MNRDKALVILSPGFPANEDDTTCLPPQQVFVKALKQNNPQLHIVIISFQYPFKASTYNWYGVEIIALAGKGRGQAYRLLTWFRALRTLRILHKKYELTGLLSFWMGECALIGTRFARKNHLKHYCWMLGQDAKAGNHYVKQVKPNKNSLIALSDSLRKEFEINYGIQPMHVIPIGVDTSLFGPALPERDIDIMGAGSLIALKQYHLFISVINSLIPAFPSLKAVICGKGPEMETLKKQIKKLKLQNNVELKGELPHREVLALMQRSKIFLHTSSYEGFGMVLSEAMYAGAHVVSLVNPMNERHTHHHVPDNAEHLPDLIKGLLSNKNLPHEQILNYPVQLAASRVAALFA